MPSPIILYYIIGLQKNKQTQLKVVINKYFVDFCFLLFKNHIQVEPPQSGNHWTLDLPDHGKFRTIGGP